MKILIGSPLYISYPLHLEFTQEWLNSIKTTHAHIIYNVVNYVDPDMQGLLEMMSCPSNPLNQKLDNNPKGNNISAAWNMMLKYGMKETCDYMIICNNDLVFRHDTVDNLIKFAQSKPDGLMWTASEYDDYYTIEDDILDDNFDEHPHFSCFAMSPVGINALRAHEDGTSEQIPGFFDESFAPAYFEDVDMHNRIIRAGGKAYKTGSAKFYHYGSRTINVDDDLHKTNLRTYEKNRSYFVNKWGFDHHSRVIDNDAPERFKYQEPFKP